MNERNLLLAELSSVNTKDHESKLAATTSKLIWLNNTQLGAPYSGGNFNFLYNPGAAEAIITYVTYISYRAKYTDQEKRAFEKRLADAIAAWDCAAQLQLKDTKGNYATKITFRFKLQIVRNPDNANKKTDVHPTNTWASWFSGNNREIVMRDMNVYIKSTFQTLCHELGHVWGLEDEYETKWIEKFFSPAHVGTDSPLLKDTTALMNIGTGFRGRYFKHFALAILKAYAHLTGFQHPVVVNGSTVAYQVMGRIALLKNDIYNGTSSRFTSLNPQYRPVAYGFRNKDRELNLGDNRNREVFLDPNDDRKPVADETKKPYCWVCKIRVRYSDPKTKAAGWSEGTGILIGANCVLTNAHVLLGKGKPAAHTKFEKIEVTIGLNNAKKIAGPFTTTKYQVHPNYGKEKASTGIDADLANSIWDYGIIRLNRTADDVKAMQGLHYWGHTASESLAIIDKNKIKGVTGKTAGYKPGSSIMIEAPGRITFINNLPAKYADRLIAHRIDTEHAQSGSPLWIEAATENGTTIPILAGMHTLGNKIANVGIRASTELFAEIAKMKRKF